MRNRNYLETLSQLKRINRQYLFDNYDWILNQLVKEDTGFVIMDGNGKDCYVLCPYYWIHAIYDEVFDYGVICAIRYAISGQCYAPELVAEFAHNFVKILTPRTINNAIKEIEQALENDRFYSPGVWFGLLDELKKHKDGLSAAAST